MRRQNYNFVTITPPATETTPSDHFMRVFVGVVTAIALTFVTFATIAILGAVR
jgi:hypothetical protein